MPAAVIFGDPFRHLRPPQLQRLRPQRQLHRLLLRLLAVNVSLTIILQHAQLQLTVLRYRLRERALRRLFSPPMAASALKIVSANPARVNQKIEERVMEAASQILCVIQR